MLKFALEVGWTKQDPFIAYRPKTEEVFREYLSRDELQQLGEKKLCRRRLHIARDLFLFSCYTWLSYADTTKLPTADIVKG
jgi:hypothetical protein